MLLLVAGECNDSDFECTGFIEIPNLSEENEAHELDVSPVLICLELFYGKMNVAEETFGCCDVVVSRTTCRQYQSY